MDKKKNRAVFWRSIGIGGIVLWMLFLIATSVNSWNHQEDIFQALAAVITLAGAVAVSVATIRSINN